MSTPATPAAIREMDLQLKGIGDETVKYSKWKRKTALYTLAKRSYQSDKPEDDGNWWRLSGARPNIPGTPTCTLPVIIARLMAYIPIGIPRNDTWNYPFKIIEEEGFLVKKQLAVWIRKWMKTVYAEAEGFTHLLVAAPKVAYTVSEYEDYIPVQVKANYDQFIGEFLNRHRGANPKLHREHISIFFSSLICGLDLFDPEQISNHYREVHGLEQGVLSLSNSGACAARVDEIVFICPSLLEIEDMGEASLAMVTEILFHRCKASGMFSNTGSGTCIKHNRAQELILGIKGASSMLYFKRFIMYLGQTLRRHWAVIQEALTSAIGDDQAVNRMLLVSSLGYKDFTGQPLESLFFEVEKRVDEYMGIQDIVVHDAEMNPQCLNTHTLYQKYNLIIGITVNLDESFNSIRVCILHTSSGNKKQIFLINNHYY